MKKVSPEFVKSKWYQAAYDYDFNITIENIRSFYSGKSWSNKAFENLRIGLETRLEAYKDFFLLHDYSWVLERNSYDFIVEPFYQLTVLDTLFGVWLSVSDENKSSNKFKNICVRQLAKWSGQKITPRSIPGNDIKFIVIPYGWDDLVRLIIEGLLKATENNNTFPLCGQDFSYCYDTSGNHENVRGNWNAILSRVISDKLECPEVFASVFITRLNEEIQELSSDFKHMPFEDKLTKGAAYSSIVSVYTIAHEVGHHLSGLKDESEIVDIEIAADLLAYEGLWNSASSFTPFIKFEINEDILCMLSGLLFYYVISMLYIANSNFDNSKKTDLINNQIAHRLDCWIDTTSKISKSNLKEYPELLDRLSHLKKLCDILLSEFDKFSKEIFPIVIDASKSILKDVLNENKDCYDNNSLNNRAGDYIRNNE